MSSQARRVPPTELCPGDRVVDGEVVFEVHAVEAHQGRVRVIDQDGVTHAFQEGELIEVH